MTEITENCNKGGNQKMNLQGDAWVGVKDASLLIISLAGAWAALVKFPMWLIKKHKIYKKKKENITFMLNKLCEGQNDLYNKIESMEEARNKARVDDADVRANMYLGQMAIIASLKEVGKRLGLEINGEVKRYYEQNIDSLRKGVGMEPLHATENKISKTELKNVAIEMNDESIAQERKEV